MLVVSILWEGTSGASYGEIYLTAILTRHPAVLYFEDVILP